MKKTMTAALVFALLLAATGCKGNDTPAETTGTTAPETTAAETTTETTTADTTVMTTVTTEVTTEETTEAVDVDEFLEGYTVYDVTIETFDEMVKTVAPENIGGQFALRFTDYPGYAVAFNVYDVRVEGKQSYQLRPAAAYAFGYIVDLTIDSMNKHTYEYGFNIVPVSDAVCVGVYPSYYIITKHGATLVDGSGDVRYGISRYHDNEKTDALWYNIWSYEYQAGQQALGELVQAYVSDEDFVCEYGYIEVTDTGISFVAEEKYNAGEWYTSDRFFNNYKDYRNLPGCETLFGLVTLYEEYLESGAYKDYSEFADWINYINQ